MALTGRMACLAIILTAVAHVSAANTSNAAAPPAAMTVTVLPQTQDETVVTLSDLLAAELAKDPLFAVVDRTQTERILTEWGLRANKDRALSWDMLVRLNVADDKSKPAVRVTCVDLSRGNVQASRTFDAAKGDDLPAKMAAICRDAAARQAEAHKTRTVRILDMGERGTAERLLPKLSDLGKRLRDCVDKQDGWVLAHHVEALTAKEESLMLYMGMSSLAGGREFMPLTDVTVSVTLAEKDAVGKPFEQTPLVAGLSLQWRGRPDANTVSVSALAGAWPDLVKKVTDELASRLAKPRDDAANDNEFPQRRQAAEKAYNAARESASLGMFRRAAPKDSNSAIRNIHAGQEGYAKALAGVLEIDPTYEPAARGLVQQLAAVAPDSPLQGRAALEAYRYLHRFPKGDGLAVDSVMDAAARSFAFARVYGSLGGPEGKTSLYAGRSNKTFAYYGWSESPSPREALRYLAEFAMANRDVYYVMDRWGALVAKAYGAMREAGHSPAELRAWVSLQLDRARPIARQNQGFDSKSQDRLCVMLTVYFVAIDSLIQDNDLPAARKLYEEARGLAKPIEGGSRGNLMGACMVLGDFARALDARQAKAVSSPKTETRSLFYGKDPPKSPFSWSLPPTYPLTQKPPVVMTKPVPGATAPVLWHNGRLLAIDNRHELPTRTRINRLVVIPMTADGHVGSPVEITVPGLNASDLTAIVCSARCGETVLLGTRGGLLVGSLADPRWKLISVEQGLPYKEVMTVFALNDTQAACYVGNDAAGKLAVCRYDTPGNSITLLRKIAHSRGLFDPTGSQAWQAGGKWFCGSARGIEQDALSSNPRYMEVPRPKPWETWSDTAAAARAGAGSRFVWFDHIYEIGPDGLLARCVAYYPTGLGGWGTPYAAVVSLFNPPPYHPGDVPTCGRSFTPVSKARSGDFFIALDRFGEAVAYQASADTWYGPVLLRSPRNSILRGERAMIAEPEGMLFFGDEQVCFTQVKDIVAAAREAGFARTTNGVHSLLRRRAAEEGPLSLALLELLAHNGPAAEKAVGEALRKDPNSPNALLLRAMINGPALYNKPKEALDDYLRLAALPDPGVRYWGMMALGQEYFRREQYTTAIQVYEKMIGEFGPSQILGSRIQGAQEQLAHPEWRRTRSTDMNKDVSN